MNVGKTGPGDSRRRRLLPLMLAALPVLVVLIAVAARPERGSLSGTGESSARLIVDSLLMLLIALDLLMIGAMVWALHGKDAPLPETPLKRRNSVISTLQAIVLIVALAYLLSLWRPPALGGDTVISRLFTGLRHVTGIQALKNGPAGHGFDWAALGIVTCLLAASAAWFWWRFIRTPHQAPTLGGQGARGDLAAAVGEALAEMELDPDPRRAVIAAYGRMERALAGRGLGRRPSEAPLEYMQRAMGSLGAGQAAVELLTQVYLEARFSHHAVSLEMRQAAISALETIRADLTKAVPGAA